MPRLLQSRSTTASFYVMNVDSAHVATIKDKLGISDLQVW
jgi:hypothetical protein